MKSLAAEGPKHRKKRCFLTPQAKYTVNCRDFNRRRVVWGWVDGRGGSAYPVRSPRGPELAVALSYGNSLLPEGERGRRPRRRPPPHRTIKNSRVLRCFLLFPFFDSCGLRWVNMGQHKMGPRWANIAPRWAHIAPNRSPLSPHGPLAGCRA